MKWVRATEKTIPKSSGFPIMLIVKWFEGEGDNERTLVNHMTANQLLDKVKGSWNTHYFLDETDNPEQLSREQVVNFLEWIIRNNWSLTDYKSKKIGLYWHRKINESPLSSDELLTEYLNKKP